MNRIVRSSSLSTALLALVTPLIANETHDDLVSKPRIDGREFARAEAQANSFTESRQEMVAIARDPAGRTVAVWHSRRQENGNYGIFAQRFAANGEKLGGEVHVNRHEPSAQTNPVVAIDAAGATWFAWESFEQDGSLGAIVARRFDARFDGASAELLVNDVTDGQQCEPSIACDAAGNAVIVWKSSPSASGATEIRARRFDSTGQALGASFRVDDLPDSIAGQPSLALSPDGSFAVAWLASDADGKPREIRLRDFAASGTGSETSRRVDTGAGRLPCEPVVRLGGDDLVVGWFEFVEPDFRPVLRRFIREASTLGWQGTEPIEIATGAAGYTTGLELALEPEGRCLVAYTTMAYDKLNRGDLVARFVERDGAIGAAFRLTSAEAGLQRLRHGGAAQRLALGADGGIVAGWHGDAGFGDGTAACVSFLAPQDGRGQALALVSELPTGPTFEDEAATPETHEPPIYDPLGARRRDQLFDPKSTLGPDYGFTGIVQTTLTPPDPHGAIGPNHFVQTVNDVIAFYTKTGTQTFSQSFQASNANDFWQPAGATGFLFDAEAIYDPPSARFMLMACEQAGGSSFFCYAISDDSDPNGTWFKYRFNVTAVGGSGIDSPNMGCDGTAVYLSADFPPYSPGGTFVILTIDKAAVLTGSPSPTTKTLKITTSQSYGQPPVIDQAEPAYYYLENLEASSNTQVKLHAIRNPLTTPTDTIFTLTVPTYTPPEDPPQMGTTTRPEAFESRFWSTAYRNGSLWGAQHTGNPVRARWYQILLNGWPTSGNNPSLVQSGDVIPAAGVRTSFVSIGVDAQSNVGLVYARSSATEFFSMSRCFRKVGDAIGTMQPSVFMKQSTSADNSGRWGDYSGCTPDPDPLKPGIWWGTHEYRTNMWSTWIGVFGPCATPVVYCTAKVTSTGGVPAIGWQNEPSLGAQNFQLTMSNGLPGKNVIAFWGDGSQAVPFMGGTLCVTLPTVRSAVNTFDGAGFVSIPFTIDVDELGLHKFAQFWFRDTAHPDGTGVGLSDAVDFVPCP